MLAFKVAETAKPERIGAVHALRPSGAIARLERTGNPKILQAAKKRGWRSAPLRPSRHGGAWRFSKSWISSGKLTSDSARPCRKIIRRLCSLPQRSQQRATDGLPQR